MSLATYLCFDYGTRRIGVAVGQTVTATATPLTTIRVKNGRPDWVKISTLIREWNPQALVVGLPVTMADGAQTMTGKAERFARQLASRYRLRVHCAEERLTTLAAKSRVKKNTDLDPVAAQIILESWLTDTHRHRHAVRAVGADSA